MAHESVLGAVVGSSQPQGVYPSRDLGQWIQSRVADAGHESTFAVEVDERYVRIRRVQGGCASMVEQPLSAPASAQDFIAALTRWASTAGLSARVSPQHGPPAVTLVRPID